MSRYVTLAKPIVSPDIPSTMSFWHGGTLDKNINFDSDFSQKHGRYEYGAGLYLTTNYDTAQRYSKGSRRLYMVTVRMGNDARETKISYESAIAFAKQYVLKANLVDILYRLEGFEHKLYADIFQNIMLNSKDQRGNIKATDTGRLRSFLVQNGVDYLLVPNAFGWHEMMMVLFNPKLIVSQQVVEPKDKIVEFDLPTDFK